MSTKIEWCEETWNPIVGCSKVSEGCANCYAEKMACRLANIADKQWLDKGSVPFSLHKYKLVTEDDKWSGHCEFDTVGKPLRWKKPRRIFVCSMGDLFHESVPFEWIVKVFAVMALCPQHTFIVLTKRAQRMLEYCQSVSNLQPESKRDMAIWYAWRAVYGEELNETIWPLPNVILGVTAENQERADERLPELMKLAKAGWKTVVSVEPMLGQVVLCWFLPRYDYRPTDGVSWVICGCESGPNRRPMDIEWARDLKNQCQEAGVAFFMKQMEIDGQVCKDITQFPEDLRIREYPESEVK